MKAHLGTAIAGNLDMVKPDKGGWLDTHENGVWSLALSDGKIFSNTSLLLRVKALMMASGIR
jgi:predicted component of type VI protein secretion system